MASYVTSPLIKAGGGIWKIVRMLWKSPGYAPVMKSSTLGLGPRVHDGGTFLTH